MPRRNLSISSMPGLRVNPLAELSDDDDEGQLPQYQSAPPAPCACPSVCLSAAVPPSNPLPDPSQLSKTLS